MKPGSEEESRMKYKTEKRRTNLLKMLLLPAFFLTACFADPADPQENAESEKSAAVLQKAENEKAEKTQVKETKPEEDIEPSGNDGENGKIQEESAGRPVMAAREEPLLPEGLGSVVLAEIGLLDEAPIRFGRQGWILRQNGLYGFIRSDGEWIVTPSYSDLFYLPGADGSEGIGYLYNEEMNWQTDARLPKDHCESGWEVPGIGFGKGDNAFLSEDGRMVFRNSAGQQVSEEECRGTVRNFTTIYPDGTGEENLSDASYLIYIPELELVSPFINSSLELSFKHHLSKKMIPSLFNRDLGRTIVLPAENGPVLASLDLKEGLTGFDRIDWIDASTFTGRHNGCFYALNGSLEQEYGARVENGGSRIGEAVPVQTDGAWKLVSIGWLEEHVPAEEWQPDRIADPFAEFIVLNRP